MTCGHKFYHTNPKGLHDQNFSANEGKIIWIGFHLSNKNDSFSRLIGNLLGKY